jgi:hypothetical protein
MTMRTPRRFSANDLLLDREILDVHGTAVGKIDDLELTEPDGGGPPVLTAFLHGPTALGPRIGGLLGAAWSALGRRLHPAADPEPHRVPLRLVDTLDRAHIRLSVPVDELPVNRFRYWARDTLIGPIPGSGR